MTTTYYAYLFEAHSIQRYVMQGGKLAEMVGASELLECLTAESGPLDSALSQLALKEGKQQDFEFSRRGGAAFFMTFKDKAKATALRDLWSLLVPQLAPGLEWNHAIATGDTPAEAINAAKTLLAAKRNQPVRNIPEANPLMRRNARTGAPATQLDAKDGKPLSLDAATVAKQKFKASTQLFQKFMSKDLLKDTKNNWEFPRNMEKSDDDGSVFPYKNDNQTIGLIHADGNGLGQVLMNLAKSLKNEEDYASIFYQLSQKIDIATRNAARKALLKVDEIQETIGVLPIRPIILGGDDLTVIVRGDLALDYAHDFLQLFEQETEVELAELHQQYPKIPKSMTACAGVAFIRANQPFYLGYQLAESLCAHAKTASRGTEEYKDNKNIPASLAFYHATTSMIADYAEVRRNELTVHIKDDPYEMSLGAYGVPSKEGENTELPNFDVLKELKEAYQSKAIARGPARHLLTLIHASPADAVQAYARWREMMRKDKDAAKVLKCFDQTAESLFQQARKLHENLPFADFTEEDDKDKKPRQYRSFLGDLTRWIAIEGEAS